MKLTMATIKLIIIIIIDLASFSIPAKVCHMHNVMSTPTFLSINSLPIIIINN